MDKKNNETKDLNLAVYPAYPHAVPRVIDDVSVVDTTSYVSLEKRLENMFMAGVALQKSRGKYDMEPEHIYDRDGNLVDIKLTPEQEDFYDPTRAPGYDMADAFQDHYAAAERIKATASDLKDEFVRDVIKNEKSQEKKEKPEDVPAST